MTRAALNDAQIQYMKQVLGLSDVLLPFVRIPEEAIRTASAAAKVDIKGAMISAKLLVLLPLSSREFPLHGPLEDLIVRMIRAMKLELADVCRVSWIASEGPLPAEVTARLEEAAPRPILIFGPRESKQILSNEAAPGVWQDLASTRAIVTLAPRDLVDSTEHKRVAWVHLQAVMKELA